MLPPESVVDIGVNLANKAFQNNWRCVVRCAMNAGVRRIILTGTSIKSSRESLRLAHLWLSEEGTANLYVTIGVHPHDAKSWDDKHALYEMEDMLEDPLALGECGLDYNRNFSSPEKQIHAFREQVQLAHKLNYAIFIHERDAHSDLLKFETNTILQRLRLSSTVSPVPRRKRRHISKEDISSDLLEPYARRSVEHLCENSCHPFRWRN